jgi:crotonobetainyl-CoA:carnitine CoA-transferase CaiB-like acyl-CoA transferase
MAQPRPLSGISVLDLTNVLSGPYCSYQLALMGAEVLKIEMPGQGDLARHLGADQDLNREGIGASFLAQNAGKKSVELDLKDPADRARFQELVRGADVVVENFRAGVMDRLGLGWQHLRELNPALIYCAITGFGQDGPLSQAPAYDQIIQGLSGMMSITGTAETAPLRVGFPICDTLGGLQGAMAVCAALASRANGGSGRFIDVSMLEASISAMGWPVSNYLVCGVEPGPMGDQNSTAAPSGTFTACDGPINIAANQQRQYENLCTVLDRADLITDSRFADRESRKDNRYELNAELNRTLKLRDCLYWEHSLNAVGVPAARIATVAQAMALDQLDHRGFLSEVPYPKGVQRSVRVCGTGVQFDGEPLRPTGPAPRLGEHNDELPALAARWLSS